MRCAQNNVCRALWRTGCYESQKGFLRQIAPDTKLRPFYDQGFNEK